LSTGIVKTRTGYVPLIQPVITTFSGLLVIVPRVRQLCVAHVTMVDLAIECIAS
jgi:UPF0716 family protein affecting phage T7 exclusion